MRARVWLAAYCICIANLADVDFIWWNGSGFTISGLFHRGFTHSLGFAMIVAAVACGVARLRGRKDYGRFALLTAVLYSSHVLADLLNEDTYPENGIGLPALWPVTDSYFIYPILPVVNRDYLFTLGNAEAIVVEVLFFGLMMIAVWGYRFWRNREAVETAAVE